MRLLSILMINLLASFISGHEMLRRRRTQIQSRIVGGKPSEMGAYPFFVNLGECGGSLVADDVVLTAAHCLGLYPRAARVGGNTYLTGDLKAIEGNGTVHPHYNPTTHENDIMLYKLDSPVAGNKTVTLNFDDNIPVFLEPLKGKKKVFTLFCMLT